MTMHRTPPHTKGKKNEIMKKIIEILRKIIEVLSILFPTKKN